MMLKKKPKSLIRTVSPYDKYFNGITASYTIVLLLVANGVWQLLRSPDYDTYESLVAAYTKPREQWPAPTVDAGIDWQELGEIPKPTYPKGKNDAMIALGKKLFFDPRISATGQIACVSCHHPDQHWTDNRRVSMGHKLLTGKRNAPSIANLSQAPHLFWDGRANSLEEQVLGPLTSNVEMNTSVSVAIDKINATRCAFGK